MEDYSISVKGDCDFPIIQSPSSVLPVNSQDIEGLQQSSPFPYLSCSSKTLPLMTRQSRSVDKAYALTKSLLCTPIKLEQVEDVIIIDGIPVEETKSSKGSNDVRVRSPLKSSGSSSGSSHGVRFSYTSSSPASGGTGSGSGNWRRTKMCTNWLRSGTCDYNPCRFAHSKEELVSVVSSLGRTELPMPLFSSSGGSSTSPFGTSYRPFIPSAVSYPSPSYQMFMPRPTAAPVHFSPYHGTPIRISNHMAMAPAPIKVRTPPERPSHVSIAKAPLRIKLLSELIKTKPLSEAIEVKPTSEPVLPSESELYAAMSLPTAPTTAMSDSDWCPLDDGIHVTFPCGTTDNKTPSGAEVEDYINRVLYGFNFKKRLPVFVEIWPGGEV